MGPEREPSLVVEAEAPKRFRKQNLLGEFLSEETEASPPELRTKAFVSPLHAHNYFKHYNTTESHTLCYKDEIFKFSEVVKF